MALTVAQACDVLDRVKRALPGDSELRSYVRALEQYCQAFPPGTPIGAETMKLLEHLTRRVQQLSVQAAHELEYAEVAGRRAPAHPAAVGGHRAVHPPQGRTIGSYHVAATLSVGTACRELTAALEDLKDSRAPMTGLERQALQREIGELLRYCQTFDPATPLGWQTRLRFTRVLDAARRVLRS